MARSAQPATSFAERIATRSLSRFYAWIVAGLVILYIATFPIFKSVILVAVPAAVAGWFYYRRGGILASILAVILNLFLIYLFIGPLSWNTLFDLQNGYLIGHIFVAVISIMFGYLRGVFENIFQLDRRLHSQERFQGLSNMIVKKILDPSKPDRLFDDIVNHLTNLFVADYGYITRWDAVQKKPFLVATTHSLADSPLTTQLSMYETRIIEHVLQTGQVLFIEDTRKMPDDIGPVNLEDSSPLVRAVICLPLVAREYKFGVALLAYGSPQHYTDEEKMFAERIGYQVALALWTVRQDEIALQQLNETRTLMQIGQTLGETERIGLDVILQLIVDSARELIPQADKTVIHLVGKDNKSLVPQAISGSLQNEGNIPYLKMNIGSGAAGQVLRDGVTINIADVNNDPRFLKPTIKPMYASLLVSPV
jgi:GAF domain-containing protein